MDEENITGDRVVFIRSVEAAAGEEEVGDIFFLEVNELFLFGGGHGSKFGVECAEAFSANVVVAGEGRVQFMGPSKSDHIHGG